MKTQKNTIIFDLDGTLLNTLDDLTNCVNHVMEIHGFPTHTTAQVKEMVGNGIYVLLEKAIPDGRNNQDYESCIQKFQTYYAAHMREHTTPFEGILPLLDRLKTQGYLLAVVSNKFDAAVKSLCADYFAPYISAAIGESWAIARKPAPDTVFAAAKQLHVSPRQCIYVGDSEVDILTAQNANIPCISVSWGFRTPEFLRSHGASYIVSDTDELFNCIQKL